MVFQEPLLTVLASAMNKVLSLDDDMAVKLKPCVGKVLELRVLPMQFCIRLLFMDHGIQFVPNLVSPPDAVIESDIGGYLQLGLGASEKMRTLFQSSVYLSGDVYFAQDVQKVLGQWHIDWEDQLAPYVGDIAAYQLVRVLRQGKQQLKTIQASVWRQMTHYLQYEGAILPTREAVQCFCTEVDQLAMAVDRLEAKINAMAPVLSESCRS